MLVRDEDRPDAALLMAWRTELIRTQGGAQVGELRAAIIEGVVRGRALMANAGKLAAIDPGEATRIVARAAVAMARYLALLGFTRRDVRRLELGRTRRSMQ